ncbi:hypothetical protein Pmani_033797 [Petrolisthes manimaculis]|uniref:Uncharacterized protein n=1 Tax=Petrolisthes manimaculis TaxID=1843537 RepID=A0AAE1NQN1_9EUCA|nr:hypothetical protein Pmani_033797 [Petrolisthes manimaculis]
MEDGAVDGEERYDGEVDGEERYDGEVDGEEMKDGETLALGLVVVISSGAEMQSKLEHNGLIISRRL